VLTHLRRRFIISSSSEERKPYVFHIAKSAFYAFVCGIRMVVVVVLCAHVEPLSHSQDHLPTSELNFVFGQLATGTNSSLVAVNEFWILFDNPFCSLYVVNHHHNNKTIVTNEKHNAATQPSNNAIIGRAASFLLAGSSHS
jgi:hypothetical protein